MILAFFVLNFVTILGLETSMSGMERFFMKRTRSVYFLRHGCTVANEYLADQGWGTPGFLDREDLRDTMLSETGVKQALDSITKLQSLTFPDGDDVLVLVSPLRRTLETFRLAAGYDASPIFGKNVRIAALPLLGERTYMMSDVGSPLSGLRRDYPFVDFDMFTDGEDNWWFQYDEEKHGKYEEWRPNTEGQTWKVKGETPQLFHQRLLRLYEFLEGRPEKHVLCVSSWGIIRELSGSDDINNCDLVRVKVADMRKRVQQPKALSELFV